MERVGAFGFEHRDDEQAKRFATAPAAPGAVALQGALGSDIKVSWALVPGAAGYRVHWRRNDTQDWQQHRDVPADVAETVLNDTIVNGTFVGVSVLSSEGAESIVTFGGRAIRQ